MALKKKLIGLIAALLAVTLLFVGLIGYLQMRRQLTSRLYESELPALVSSVRNDIEKKLTVYLTASQGIAANSYLRDWFARGEPEKEIETWVRYASTLVAQVNASGATFASHETRKHYSEKGYYEEGSNNLPFWLDKFLASNKPYEVALDNNRTTGFKWKMFINVRLEEGDKKASVGLGIDAEKLVQEILTLKFGKEGIVYLTTANGAYKLHQNPGLISVINVRNVQGIETVADRLLRPEKGKVHLASYTGKNGKKRIVGSSWIPALRSFVFVELPAEEVFGELTQTMFELTLVLCSVFALAVLAAFFLARQVAAPIVHVTEAVERLSEGDIDVPVDLSEQKGEVGAIACALESFRQILVRRRAENSRKNLEVEHDEAALERALRESERANQAKLAFLATMSHEFRTPLNAIIGFSEMLSEQYFGPVGSENYREYLKDIHESGKHLLALINDILDVTEADAGQHSVIKEKIEPIGFFDRTIHNFTEVSERKNIDLSYEVEEALDYIYADKRALMQILFNLLSNALKYTENGGKVTLTAKISGVDVVLSVIDTGIGISADHLPQLLEPFMCLTSGVQMTREGAGLSLAIVRALVSAHGGEIDIDSAEGEGTTVKVILPLMP